MIRWLAGFGLAAALGLFWLVIALRPRRAVPRPVKDAGAGPITVRDLMRRRDRERDLCNAERATTIAAVLPVYDSLELALAHHREVDVVESTAVAGLQAILRQFDGALRAMGVQPIVAFGTDFDPSLHEAVAIVPPESPGLAGKVVDVVERGFLIDGDRLLRPAKVVVAQPDRPT